MAAPVARTSQLQSSAARAIDVLVQNRTIEPSLAADRRLASLLESQTLQDFLKDFPRFQIRDGQIPPFLNRAAIPGLESLIACINLQWTRHYLTHNTPSSDEISSISETMTLVWRDQIPELLSLLFQDNPKAFLNADVLLQQTIVLVAQDYFEAMYPKFKLPQSAQAFVREFESLSTDERDLHHASLVVLAQDKLDRLHRKEPLPEAKAD